MKKSPDQDNDCLMYVPEADNCNALARMECERCRFYKSATADQREAYKQSMQKIGSYLKPKKVKERWRKETC